MVGTWLKCVQSGSIYEYIMETATLVPTKEVFGLFDTVPEDYLKFGQGTSFDPKLVPKLLGLKNEDVSRLAAVSVKSVRYDEHIPQPVYERLEEIAGTINMVAKVFQGDTEKTVAWFKARNPLLGDVSPRDMIRLGRYERLRKFIINAMLNTRTPPHQPQAQAAAEAAA